MPGQEANGDNLGESFLSSIQNSMLSVLTRISSIR